MVGSLMSLAVLFGCFAVSETQGSQDCTWNGKNDYEQGKSYYLEGFWKCFSLLCYKGNWKMLGQDCDAENTCRSVGTEYFMNGCNRYLCANDSSGTPQNVFQEQYCTDHYGRCHPPGQRFDYSVMGNFSNNCTCEFADDSSEPTYSCSDEPV